MFELNDDGSAHIIGNLKSIFAATWTLDPESGRVTTSWRRKDGLSVERRVTYVPERDVLIGWTYGSNQRDRVFRRASQDEIEWWAGERPRIVAEEAEERSRREESAPVVPPAIAELRDSAHVVNSHVWRNNFQQYLRRHQIYVCVVARAPEAGSRRAHWQLSISSPVRGPRSGALPCALPDGPPPEIGSRVIVLGNEHKTGFHTISWWEHSAEVEERIRQFADAEGESSGR